MTIRVHNKLSTRNLMLVRMWEINNKLANKEMLANEEIDYWNDHLKSFQQYYRAKYRYTHKLRIT
jgi:hypothetical protein